MAPMLTKHKFIVAVLFASLSLTACGSKKSGGVAAPAPKQEKTDSTNGKIGGGLPDPNDPNSSLPPTPNEDNTPGPIKDQPKTPPSQGGTKTPPQNQPAPLPKNPAPAPAPVKPAPPAVKPAPPAAPSTPAPLPAPGGSNPVPPDYRTNDPSNVAREGLSKRFTGGVGENGLYYTSSSTDELLSYLRSRNEKVSYETRQLNIQAAASVVSAKLSLDSLSGDAIVTLKVKEGGDIKVYNLAGSNGNEGTASALRAIRGGNGEKSTGLRAIEGTLKCVDFDGGCDTTFARVKIGSTGSSAIINVVFRKSKADLYFNLPAVEKESGSYEFSTIRDYLLNTVKKEQTTEKIKSTTISSWEVVNGRSGVTVSTLGGNGELLAFEGPLLAPEAGTGVNVRMSPVANNQDDSLDVVGVNQPKLNYANWIAEARMVANNGLGQVKVALKMRKRSAYAQDQFAITFMRQVKPIVDLTDDNLK